LGSSCRVVKHDASVWQPDLGGFSSRQGGNLLLVRAIRVHDPYVKRSAAVMAVRDLLSVRRPLFAFTVTRIQVPNDLIGFRVHDDQIFVLGFVEGR
jgi:hypothetical protein